ncbi:MAG: hypothetical protein GF313_17320 [Caldithrix sp.]|nr:hypothetical protein [Caldithrix sp.]
MDIKDKLAYYSAYRKKPKNSKSDNVYSSLQALRDYFDGEFSEPSTSYLKISRKFSLFKEQNDSTIAIPFLSANKHKAAFNLKDCIFFDLETNGLAGGAGTFAFLLGFGYVEDGDLIVNQYFLPDYGREYSLYTQLLNMLNQYHTLISYNGKSYDFPLFKTRLILNHLPGEFNSLQHVDLLHIARRIWKRSLPACDLNSIETYVLQKERSEDIPGYLIPQAYMNFLQTGVIHDIIKIIEHNYHDIVSLAQLLLLFNRIEKEPNLLKDNQALFSLAQLAYKQNHQAYLNRFITEYEKHRDPNKTEQMLVWQSLLHKKRSEWVEAISLWENLIRSRKFGLFALEELAKYEEHVVKNYERALQLTTRAIHNVQTLNELHSTVFQDDALSRFLHRRRRLQGKLS